MTDVQIFDLGALITIATIVASIVAWEYKKMATLKREIQKLRDDMQQLHTDHGNLLMHRDNEHTEVLRNLTSAINKMHSSIDELTHYIRWLGKTQTGSEPPPPIGVRS